jgi:WD40 repeat protein
MLNRVVGLLSLAWFLVLVKGGPLSAQEPTVFPIHRDRVTKIAFSSDNAWLASASFDKSVILTNLRSLKEDRILKHESSVFTLAFAPDNKILATGGTETPMELAPIGVVVLWNPANGQRLETLKGETLTNPVGCLAFSGTGKYLAFGCASPLKARIGAKGYLGELRIWDRESKQMLPSIPVPESPPSAVDFSSDGKLVAFASGNPVRPLGAARIWDVEKHKEIGKVEWDTDAVYAVSFSPKESILAVGGGRPFGSEFGKESVSSRLVLWDYERGKERTRLKGHRFLVYTVAFSPDGKILATGGGDYGENEAELKLWDTRTGNELLDLSSAHRSLVTSVAFSNDGKFGSASHDKTIKVWDLAKILPKKQQK